MNLDFTDIRHHRTKFRSPSDLEHRICAKLHYSKGIVIPGQTMTAHTHTGAEVPLQLFLTSALDRGQRSTSCHSCFTPGNNPDTSFHKFWVFFL